MLSDKEFGELKKKVDYANMEQLFGEDKQVHLFRGIDELVEALRAGEIPGVTWTEECEAKWQMEKRLEQEILPKPEHEYYEDPWGYDLGE